MPLSEKFLAPSLPQKIFHVNPRQIKKIQQLPRLIVTRVKIKRDNPRKKKSTLAYIDIKNY